MKIPKNLSGRPTSWIGKPIASAIAAALLCSMSVGTAFADDHRGRGDDHRYDHRHDRGDYRGRHDPYFYAAPVYAPPVYAPPQPASGVSLFFPLDIRIH